MTTPSPDPKVVVDCTVVVVEPAVVDANGNVVRPPVLQLPTVTAVDLTADETAAWQTDVAAATSAADAAAAARSAAALVELRMIRDRWLAQTDYIEVYLADPTGFSPLPQAIQDAVTANKTGWAQWRQALRDLPGTSGLDQVAAVAAISAVHATTDTFPSPWPQPPTTPVIHLT